MIYSLQSRVLRNCSVATGDIMNVMEASCVASVAETLAVSIL